MHSQAVIALGAFAIFFVGIALTICLVILKKMRQQNAHQQTPTAENSDNQKNH